MSHEISKNKYPARILVGASDERTDTSKAEILQGGIANSSLDIISRAGHMSPYEEHEIVNELIREHLTSIILLLSHLRIHFAKVASMLDHYWPKLKPR